MGKLNALSVKHAKPGRHQDGQGLYLDVGPSGRGSWAVRVQVDGKRRDFGLGGYPLIGLSEARDKASETRKQFKQGIDPAAAKRALRALKSSVLTFKEAANAAHAERKGSWRNRKHSDQWLSSLKTYAFPAIGDMKVDEIQASHVRDLLQPIWLVKPETARRTLQRIGTVLDWAHAKDLRPHEAPIRSILKGLQKQPKRDRHFAAVPYQEVPAFVRKLSDRESIGRSALHFLILTAARSGEVRGATWEEIDFVNLVWTIPADRMKAGREHIVPLSDAAVAILRAMQPLRTGRVGEHIFPGLRRRRMSDMTLAKVLRSTRPGKDTVHGFRSSFRDWAADKTEYSGEIVEAALAHVVANKTEAAYRRTNYLEKRRNLMSEWARFVANEPIQLATM